MSKQENNTEATRRWLRKIDSRKSDHFGFPRPGPLATCRFAGDDTLRSAGRGASQNAGDRPRRLAREGRAALASLPSVLTIHIPSWYRASLQQHCHISTCLSDLTKWNGRLVMCFGVVAPASTRRASRCPVLRRGSCSWTSSASRCGGATPRRRLPRERSYVRV